jgi:outer membrane receptor protein involved in Fe transport
LLIPVLADTPFFQELNFEFGGRMSDYNTTGTSWTYKALADWAVNDWLRFRGGYNRAERAPNIGELFLARSRPSASTTRGDVCSRLNPFGFSANPAVNASNAAAVEGTCRALMNAAGADAINLYYGPVGGPCRRRAPQRSPSRSPTLVGNPNLVPEKADTWTAGFVDPVADRRAGRCRACACRSTGTTSRSRTRSAPRRSARCSSSASIRRSTRQSREPTSLARPPRRRAERAAVTLAEPFCQLLPRNRPGQLGNVLITYANTGRVHLQGIDAQLDWGIDVGPGTFTVNSVFNYQIDFESSALYPQLPLIDYVGTTGSAGERPEPERVRVSCADHAQGYSWDASGSRCSWQYLPRASRMRRSHRPGGTPNTNPGLAD